MIKIFKNLTAFIFYYLRLWLLLYLIIPIFRKKYLLEVITFHRIIPKEKVKIFSANYDIGHDQHNYEIILKEISKYFQIINLDEYIDYILGAKKLNKHSILITFDDADSDFDDDGERESSPARSVNKRQARALYERVIRALARAKARNRKLSDKTRNGQLFAWLGDGRVPRAIERQGRVIASAPGIDRVDLPGGAASVRVHEVVAGPVLEAYRRFG